MPLQITYGRPESIQALPSRPAPTALSPRPQGSRCQSLDAGATSPRALGPQPQISHRPSSDAVITSPGALSPEPQGSRHPKPQGSVHQALGSRTDLPSLVLPKHDKASAGTVIPAGDLKAGKNVACDAKIARQQPDGILRAALGGASAIRKAAEKPFAASTPAQVLSKAQKKKAKKAATKV